MLVQEGWGGGKEMFQKTEQEIWKEIDSLLLSPWTTWRIRKIPLSAEEK